MALKTFGERLGIKMDLLQSVVGINQRQPGEVVRLLRKNLTNLSGTRVTVLGLAFKPGTDDVRESPSLRVIELLQQAGASVTAHDPLAKLVAPHPALVRGLHLAEDLEEAIDGSEAIVIMTGWPEYIRLPELIAHASPQPVVVDGRRILEKSDLVHYEGIGL